MARDLTLLDDLSSQDFADDEPGRLAALTKARALVARLEKPWETIDNLVWTTPILTTTIRVAGDVQLFSHLDSTSQPTSTLAEKTSTDPALLDRLCRMLVAANIIDEGDVPSTYTATPLSTALATRDGLISGIYHFYDVQIPQMQHLPEFLKEINYRNPIDKQHTPWEYITRQPQVQHPPRSGHLTATGENDFWKWFQQHPDAQRDFQAFLSSIRVGQPPWPSWYPFIQNLVQGFGLLDNSDVFLVDVGGGKGRDIQHAADALLHSDSSSEQKQLWGKARLILQDLPSVISSYTPPPPPSSNTPTNPTVSIEPISHDFFYPQPVHHARAYFLHSILHDWPDREALLILAEIKRAMKPGYSKLLLLETVLPASARGMRARWAAMDLNMMAHYSALERTESQWRALLEAAGLRFVKFYELEGHVQGIIEAEI